MTFRKSICIQSTIEMSKEGIKQFNAPQRTRSSSDPSGQFWWVSQRKYGLVQLPSLHWNCESWHTRCGQVGGSSEPSKQSFCPSHFHQIGIHLHKENIPLLLAKPREPVGRGVGNGYLERRGKTEFQVMRCMSSLMAWEESQLNLGYCGIFSEKT